MSSAIGLGFEALYGVPIHRLVECGELSEEVASAFVPFLEKIMTGVQHASSPVLITKQKVGLDIVYFDQQQKINAVLGLWWGHNDKKISASISVVGTAGSWNFHFDNNPVSFRAIMARIVA